MRHCSCRPLSPTRWRTRWSACGPTRTCAGVCGKLPFGGSGRSGNDRPAGITATLYCTTPQSHLENEAGEMTCQDLAAGEARRVPVGRKHRFEALDQQVELIEVSTPELDDVVRLEDDFGRKGTGDS